MEKARLAILGEADLEPIITEPLKTRIGTPYGPSPIITIGKINDKDVAFLPRYGEKHTAPPHKINYRANMWALNLLGVEQILATEAVRGISPKLRIGDIVIPHDLIDFTRLRSTTFYDEAPVAHINMADPYCPELRQVLLKAAKKVSKKVVEKSVYVCTEGPRFETPAEIAMFRKLGGNIVGMTGIPEVFLARELGICYAILCFVTNIANEKQPKSPAKDLKMVEKLKQTLKEAFQHIPDKRECICSKMLDEARI